MKKNKKNLIDISIIAIIIILTLVVAIPSYSLTNYSIVDPFPSSIDFNNTTNLISGNLADDKYWGTIVSNDIPVDSTKDYALVEIKNTHSASSRLIHYIFFYDENGNYLKNSSYNNGYPGTSWTLLPIPKNAKFMRIGINSSYHATKITDYQAYFNSNDLEVRYKYINLDTDRTLLDEKISSNETMLSSISDFNYNSLSTTTGELTEDKYWGSLTTNYLPINDGDTTFNYRLTTRLSGLGMAIHYICYYDSSYNFISSLIYNDATGLNTANLVVPTNAKYVRLGLNSTTSAHSYSNYTIILKSGDATLIYNSSK